VFSLATSVADSIPSMNSPFAVISTPMEWRPDYLASVTAPKRRTLDLCHRRGGKRCRTQGATRWQTFLFLSKRQFKGCAFWELTKHRRLTLVWRALA